MAAPGLWIRVSSAEPTKEACTDSSKPTIGQKRHRGVELERADLHLISGGPGMVGAGWLAGWLAGPLGGFAGAWAAGLTGSGTRQWGWMFDKQTERERRLG